MPSSWEGLPGLEYWQGKVRRDLLSRVGFHERIQITNLNNRGILLDFISCRAAESRIFLHKISRQYMPGWTVAAFCMFACLCQPKGVLFRGQSWYLCVHLHVDGTDEVVWRCVSTATVCRLWQGWGSKGLLWIFYDRPHYSTLASLWEPSTERTWKVWQFKKSLHCLPSSNNCQILSLSMKRLPLQTDRTFWLLCTQTWP